MRGRAAHTRIWLQQKATATNSVGAEVDTWSDVVKVSAVRKEERGSERIEANRIDADQAVLWSEVRISEEVTTDWRIRTAGTEADPDGIQHIRSIAITRLLPKEIEILAEKE